MTILPNKKVSVIVPNYNYGKYLNKRISSILRQTYPIYELIILDDASHDNSDEILKRIESNIKQKQPGLKFKIIKNKNNSGKAILQWKKGFEEASGDYVWIAEADDLSRRKFLEEVMRGFEDEKVALSYTESMIINGAGVMLAPNFRWSRDKEKIGHYRHSYIKNGEQEIKEIMAIRCSIPNVSAVVFRNDKRIIEYLKEAAKFAQVGDWYLYLKILENGKISYNHKSLNMFRVHKDSVTGKSKGNDKHYHEVVQIHEMIKNKYQLDDDTLRYIYIEEKRLGVI